MRLRKIAFINAKGGVAKTTSCVNIGAGLALGGYRTLLVDLDSQGQITKSLGVQAGEGLAELVQGDAGLGDVQIEARENLFVIAGGGGLSGVKRMISCRDMRSELVLSEALEDLHGYDFVLRKSAETLEQLERHFPDALWPCVRYNSKLSEAPGFGQHIFEYSKRSNGAADYARLADRSSREGERGHGQGKTSAGRPHGNDLEGERGTSPSCHWHSSGLVNSRKIAGRIDET